MTKTFYIASSRDRLAEVRELARKLFVAGMNDAFPWHVHFEHTCSAKECGVRDRPALAEFELFAASQCDLFIGIARMGKGAHVELGAALVSTVQSRIILVGADRADSVFYEAKGVEHVANFPALLELLKRDGLIK